MKSILLFAHNDKAQESRLQAALALARTFDAHLTCLDVLEPPLLATYGDVLMEAQVAEEASNRQRLEARLAREDVAWSWSEGRGYREDVIAGAADLEDVIVLSLPSEGDLEMELRQLVARIATRSKQPVLAVPRAAGPFDPKGRALIAWDGSREADAALRAGVPLLKQSEDVVLFEIEPRGGIFEAASAASYLSRHDIHVRIDSGYRKAHGDVGDAILDKAHEIGAAYIVMGAYGHAPTLEALVGGATRSMLKHSDVPLLLVH
jgi:nucleotide-binding universal stress UspA family protein